MNQIIENNLKFGLINVYNDQGKKEESFKLVILFNFVC